LGCNPNATAQGSDRSPENRSVTRSSCAFLASIARWISSMVPRGYQDHSGFHYEPDSEVRMS
jgi:hypothetical protein